MWKHDDSVVLRCDCPAAQPHLRHTMVDRTHILPVVCSLYFVELLRSFLLTDEFSRICGFHGFLHFWGPRKEYRLPERPATGENVYMQVFSTTVNSHFKVFPWSCVSDHLMNASQIFSLLLALFRTSPTPKGKYPALTLPNPPLCSPASRSLCLSPTWCWERSL